MINICKNKNINKDKNKFNYYKKKILSMEMELEHIGNLFPSIDYDKIDKIQKDISTYKLIVNLLYYDPDFYSEVKYIQIDCSQKNPNEIAYLEIIWDMEHYEYIEKIRNCSNDIVNLIKFGHKYNIITYIQYKFVKKTLGKINEIFESDKSIGKLYGIKPDITTIISKNEVELFFDILDIIILKINLNKKSISNETNETNETNVSNVLNVSTETNITNITNISNILNIPYTNLIKKIKLNLEQQII